MKRSGENNYSFCEKFFCEGKQGAGVGGGMGTHEGSFVLFHVELTREMWMVLEMVLQQGRTCRSGREEVIG